MQSSLLIENPTTVTRNIQTSLRHKWNTGTIASLTLESRFIGNNVQKYATDIVSLEPGPKDEQKLSWRIPNMCDIIDEIFLHITHMTHKLDELNITVKFVSHNSNEWSISGEHLKLLGMITEISNKEVIVKIPLPIKILPAFTNIYVICEYIDFASVQLKMKYTNLDVDIRNCLLQKFECNLPIYKCANPVNKLFECFPYDNFQITQRLLHHYNFLQNPTLQDLRKNLSVEKQIEFSYFPPLEHAFGNFVQREGAIYLV